MAVGGNEDRQRRLLSRIQEHRSRHGHFTHGDLSEILRSVGGLSARDLDVLWLGMEKLVDPSSGELDLEAFVEWLFAGGSGAEPAAEKSRGKVDEEVKERGVAFGVDSRAGQEEVAAPCVCEEYRTAASIAAALRSRSAVLVDGEYFAQAHAEGRRLEPRQVIEKDYPQFVVGELEEEKLFAMKVDSLGKCWLMGAPEGGVVVAAVSYGWLASTHPDPEGYHLQMLAGLAAHFQSVLRRYKLKLALFLDYCSLYQKPKTKEQEASFQRTPEQAALFKEGLNGVNLWYAHQLVQVWLLRSVPPASPNPTPYDDRGWTTFERHISVWVSFLTFDFSELGEGDPAGMPPLVEEEAPKLYCVFSAQLRRCRAGSSLHQYPPLRPAAFDGVISEKRFTNGQTDLRQVKDLYARTFLEVLSAATSLSYSGRSWDDDDLVELADILPECLSLEDLDLSENPVGDAGVQACIGRCRPLAKLGLANTGITDSSLASAAKAFTGLTHVVGNGTQVGDVSVRALAENCPGLECAVFSDTKTSDDAVSLLARACPRLAHLDLDRTPVGDAGVARVAQCCPGLKVFSLRSTGVTDDSIGQLVQCRGLDHLMLCYTRVSDDAVRLLAENCRGLKYLALSDTRVTDASIAFAVERLPAMTVLNLAKTRLTDMSVAAIARHCRGIAVLILTGTAASDESVKMVAERCTSLTVLCLEDTQVTDASVCKIAMHLPKLTSLDLDNTRVGDTSVTHVARGCPELTRLSLRGTQVTDASVMHVATNLSHLSYLSLNEGQVSPECLGRLQRRTGLTIVNT